MIIEVTELYNYRGNCTYPGCKFHSRFKAERRYRTGSYPRVAHRSRSRLCKRHLDEWLETVAKTALHQPLYFPGAASTDVAGLTSIGNHLPHPRDPVFR